MMMSSIIYRTPGRPSSIPFILFWKYSGADVIPKGGFRKQYLPNEVMNVVSSSGPSLQVFADRHIALKCPTFSHRLRHVLDTWVSGDLAISRNDRNSPLRLVCFEFSSRFSASFGCVVRFSCALHDINIADTRCSKVVS